MKSKIQAKHKTENDNNEDSNAQTPPFHFFDITSTFDAFVEMFQPFLLVLVDISSLFLGGYNSWFLEDDGFI